MYLCKINNIMTLILILNISSHVTYTRAGNQTTSTYSLAGQKWTTTSNRSCIDSTWPVEGCWLLDTGTSGNQTPPMWTTCDFFFSKGNRHRKSVLENTFPMTLLNCFFFLCSIWFLFFRVALVKFLRMIMRYNLFYSAISNFLLCKCINQCI